MTRAEQIQREILTRKNGVWDAYDQGRWAAAMGYGRENNPHRIASIPTYFHTNINAWFDGWDHETRDWGRRGDENNWTDLDGNRFYRRAV